MSNDELQTYSGDLVWESDKTAILKYLDAKDRIQAMKTATNTQTAPYPIELEQIVNTLKYRPGWQFHLKNFERDPGSEGLTFVIRSLGYDTYHPDRGESYGVLHYFPVPPATYNRASWLEWVRDRLIEVETHETCEFMQVGDKRPFAPNHGPGWNPYAVRTLNQVENAETTFRGEHREGTQ